MPTSPFEHKLVPAIVVALLLAVAYQACAGYLLSPQGTGLRYPNPGHHPGEIGPGIFNCSGAINCFWKFPAKVIIEGILNLTGHDIVGVNKVSASEVCIGGDCRSGWPSQPSIFSSYVWKYRKAVTIQENSGNNLDGYQILLTLDTRTLINEGKMRKDCADIRIVDENGNYLPYWVESGCGGTNTRIWIKMPHLTPYESKTLYVYYGNPKAHSLSSRDSVFHHIYQTFSAQGGDIGSGLTVNSGVRDLPDPSVWEPYKVYVDVYAGIVQDSPYSFTMKIVYDGGSLERAYSLSRDHLFASWPGCSKKIKMNPNPIDITSDVNNKHNISFKFIYSAYNRYGGCSGSFSVYLNGYYKKRAVSPPPNVSWGTEQPGNFTLEDPQKLENIATGVLMSFDHIYGNYEAWKDENPSTGISTLRWYGNGFLTFDLGEWIDLGILRLRGSGCIRAGGCDSGEYIQALIEVYVSSDGSHWTLLESIKGPKVFCGGGWQSCVSSTNKVWWASNFRYVKVVLGGSGNMWMRKHYGSLSELEVLKVKMT